MWGPRILQVQDGRDSYTENEGGDVGVCTFFISIESV